MDYRYQLLYKKKEIGRINDAVIALCGVGGYGSALIDPLARYEVGEVRIADPDIVELSNMDRQAIAKFSTLHRKKVEISAGIIGDITQKTTAALFHQGVVPLNVDSFCDNTDAVIDLCDQLSTRLLLQITCNKLKVPFIRGGSVSWPNRQGIKVEVYRFDKKIKWRLENFNYKKWGLSLSLWSSFVDESRNGCFSLETLRNIDLENAVWRSRNTPLQFGTISKVAWNAGGGYDPLKILSVTTKILEELITILIGRRPRHHLPKS